MARLRIPTRDEAPEASRAILNEVHRHFGKVPGLFRLLASSPAVLTGFANFSAALDTVLDVKTRTRIALAVSQVNECQTCLSANNYLALNVARIDPKEIELARQGKSSDLKAAAAVRFATKVVTERGRVGNDDIDMVRAAGFSDSEIVEIVALVALCLFTNFLNEVAQTDIDFPAVRSVMDG